MRVTFADAGEKTMAKSSVIDLTLYERKWGSADEVTRNGKHHFEALQPLFLRPTDELVVCPLDTTVPGFSSVLSLRCGKAAQFRTVRVPRSSIRVYSG